MLLLLRMITTTTTPSQQVGIIISGLYKTLPVQTRRRAWAILPRDSNVHPILVVARGIAIAIPRGEDSSIPVNQNRPLGASILCLTSVEFLNRGYHERTNPSL